MLLLINFFLSFISAVFMSINRLIFRWLCTLPLCALTILSLTDHVRCFQMCWPWYLMTLFPFWTVTTRLTRRKTTLINYLTFTTFNIGVLDTWVINNELLTPTDHEFIFCNLVDLNGEAIHMCISQEYTGWSFRSMFKDNGMEVVSMWHLAATDRRPLGQVCTTTDVEEEKE